LMVLSLSVPAWAVVFTNPASITINDATAIGTASSYPATINVSGLTGTVTNVTLTLNNMNHTFPDDLDIMLAGPTAANLIVVSDNGGSDDMSNTTITIDDAAAAVLPDAVRYNSGSFKPSNIGAGDTWTAPAPAPSVNTTMAATFNGTDPNGAWNLWVADDLGVDMGVIGNGWSLTITTSGSPATTFSSTAPIHGGDGARGRASAYASTIVASGLTGAITDVNVTLTNINHLNPDDLDILLVGPTGKSILLTSDAGGTADVVSVNLTFDDAGALVIPDAGPMVTNTVKPTNFGTGDTMPDIPAPYPNSSTAGSATLASVFNGTEPNGTWKLYICDDATTSAGTVAGGWSIDITAGGTYGAKRFTAGDFDGDGKTDAAVWRESTRQWFWRDSASYANRGFATFGSAGDIPVPGDYDGDGKTDIAVWRPSNGVWYVVESSTATLTQAVFGLSSDTPVAADYDGDGKFDKAVFRGGANATWYVLQSASNTVRSVAWGTTGDAPVRGHFEGTNGADFAVFRASNNVWYILNNAASSFRAAEFGTAGDVNAQADYDGDGKTDIAMWRASSGDFFILNSATSSFSGVHWGATGDTPTPGDYDGDSRADVAVFRTDSGGWYILNSGTPAGAAAVRQDVWGQTGDKAVPRLYLPNF
jgi:subtilisin-like proprotein convertase family protein